jgi:HD-like signal output (HDOD) protein
MHTEELAARIRKRFNSGEAKLPVLPEAVIKVKAVIDDPNKGANDIAEVIASDPTFSSTVMRIANSAQFNAGNREIRNLPMAIHRLGARQTLHLLIAVSSQMHMNVKDARLAELIRRTARHSLMVGCIAQHLAHLIRGCDAEESFLAGVLYEVGIPAIVCAVPGDLAPLSDDQLAEALKILHREMGGRLLNHWDMPSVFIEVASHHGVEADDRPRTNMIDLIDASIFLLQGAGHASPFDEVPDNVEAIHYAPMQRLGITETHLAAAEVELDDFMAEMGGLFAQA